MGSELLFSRVGGRLWAAVREDGATAELRVAREREPLPVGRIVKGRVSRILPGIQSAFLDVGQEREAFLHAADVVLPGEAPSPAPLEAELATSIEDPADEDPEGGLPLVAVRRANLPRGLPIERRLRVGQEIVVQVARESIGTKGPRTTCFVTLPGRHLVYMPNVPYRAISRRIAGEENRERLGAIVRSLPPASGGFIVRTAAARADEDALRADADELAATWAEILARAEGAKAPALLHGDLELPLRMLRDVDRDAVVRIVTDDAEILERARAYLVRREPTLAAKLRWHGGPEPLFDAAGVSSDVDRALRPKVWLRSGGTLVIEPTEALVSIDVNTGKFLGSRSPEETALRTNLEAAAEIARQLRLRDLGGIIVVDFIDMDLPESRRRVLEALEEALSKDRSRTKVVGLSELGLVQLTRKRTRPGFADSLTRICPACAGRGRVLAQDLVAEEAIREAERLRRTLHGSTVRVRAHPEVAAVLRGALLRLEGEGAAELAAGVVVEDDPETAPDQFEASAI